MRILIVGVGDAFTRKHFGSSALIETTAAGGPSPSYVLIDCPDLIHRALHEATARARWTVDASNIHDIIITHLHGDHCNGLESFGFFRRITRVQNPGANTPKPRLHTSAPVAERLWQRLAPAMDAAMGGARPSALDDYFDVCLLNPDRPATIAGLTVRCRFTQHPVPTTGLLLSDGRRTFGWSADTPFEQAHVDWLAKSADVFVHESNLGPAHTPIAKLNSLDEKMRRKIRLIHLVDNFDPSSTDIHVLREGEVLDL
jgi:ribonuclease BN (tRNA processing enzyme)